MLFGDSIFNPTDLFHFLGNPLFLSCSRFSRYDFSSLLFFSVHTKIKYTTIVYTLFILFYPFLLLLKTHFFTYPFPSSSSLRSLKLGWIELFYKVSFFLISSYFFLFSRFLRNIFFSCTVLWVICQSQIIKRLFILFHLMYVCVCGLSFSLRILAMAIFNFGGSVHWTVIIMISVILVEKG